MICGHKEKLSHFRREAWSRADDQFDLEKGKGSKLHVIRTYDAKDLNFETTPRWLNDQGDEVNVWSLKGTKQGGWAQNYIEAKIELYADGKKGGDHGDLLQYAKDRGHNLGFIPIEQPPLPSTDEVRREVAAMAAIRERATGGGSSSSD